MQDALWAMRPPPRARVQCIAYIYTDVSRDDCATINTRVYIARLWSIERWIADDAASRIGNETNSIWEFLSRLSFAREFPGASDDVTPHSDHGTWEICRAPRDKSFSPMAESFPVGGRMAGSEALHRRRTSALQQSRPRYNLRAL